MHIKVIVINLITLIFVCWSLYFIRTTNTINIVLKKKDAVVSSISNALLNYNTAPGTAQVSSSSVQKVLNKMVPQPVEKQYAKQIVTPDPLQQIKKGLGLNDANNGAITIAGVIDRTNYERAQNSLPGLTESAELDASAQVKANDILARQYFEHVSPDGKSVSDLVTAANYQYIRVGENLALGDFTDNVDLLTAWMNSPGHRANILDKRYEDIGIGIAYGNYQGRFVVVAVQHFGRPRSSCPNVDEQLKNKIVDDQSQINKITPTLDILKNTIDTMRAKGEYVDNTIIDAYNNGVEQYDSIVLNLTDTRTEYNSQVKAFNTCLSAL